jgi:hypothetical protein
MRELNSEFLFDLHIKVAPPIMVGQTPMGFRLIANITGGHFQGPSMSGRILASGGDWVIIRPDGSLAIDVRIVLETEDNVLIYADYRGRQFMSQEVSEKLNNPDTAGQVDSSLYYWRTSLLFEVPVNSAYDWLNNVVAVGIGHRVSDTFDYSVHVIR